nr:GNVR domain-containing protein [Methyloversatilis sp. XJ19-49]
MASLQKKLDTLHQRLTEYNAYGLQLAELTRAQMLNEQSYLAYRKKAEELRISDELNAEKISGVRVISDARPPVEPAAPRRLLILGIALLVGLFLGVGYSAISEYFDDTFRSADDVRRILGADLMLTVPHHDAGSRR